MFQPASNQKNDYLKVLVYGPTDVGKTQFGLQAMGRKAVVDTEGKTKFFVGRFDFDVLETQTYDKLKQIVNYIKENPNKYDVLVIDSITPIYQLVKDEAVATRSSENKNIAVTEKEWGIVKQNFASLITSLFNLPCHLIITAWSKDEFEGKGGNKKKIGTCPDVDQKLQYLPDVRIRLEVDSKSGNHFGVIEKDYTLTYQKGQRINDISFNNFLMDRVKEETLNQITELWDSSGYEAKKINIQTSKLYGCTVYGLTEEQGQDFLKRLNQVKDQQAEATEKPDPEPEPQPEKEAQKESKEKRSTKGNRYAALFAAGKERGLSQEDTKKKVYGKLDIESLTKLTDEELTEVTQWIKSMEQEELADTKKVS